MDELNELNPVDHICAGCKGEPGQRVFYLQARKGAQLVTLLCEKFQMQQLAAGITKYLDELQARFGQLTAAVTDFEEAEMELEEPLEPRFRAGQLGLGYDEAEDLLVLVAQELLDDAQAAPGKEPPAGQTVRFWATRQQMLNLAAHISLVASRGRPVCGNCLQPVDPDGHFCPRRNGFKH
jgi:uncharacterized repeat protein (TIGR03847 family)